MKKITLALSLTLSFLIFNFSLSKAQPKSFAAHGIGGGGAFYCPVVNPANNKEMFLTTDMSDMYHSTDGGNSWTVVNFTELISGGILSQVQFTNTSGLLYCTSENVTSEVLYPVVSTNDGATWAPLTTDPSGGNGVYYLVANPQNSNQLIVSDYNNFYFSNNGGKTFSSAFYTDATGNGAYLAGAFFDGANIYVCAQTGLIVSTNSGSTWSAPTEPGISSQDIVSFAGAKSGSTTRFFCVTQGSGDVGVPSNPENYGNYASVYSVDYPGTWVQKTTGINAGDGPFFVSMNSSNIGLAYLAGATSAGTPMVLKSNNAGASWSYVFNTTNNQNIQTGYCGAGGDIPWYWPTQMFGLTVSNADSNTIVVSDEGFAHKTTNGGKTWQAIYVPAANLNPDNATTPDGLFYPSNGLENTSCWTMSWFDSLHVFAGFSDVCCARSINGGNTWAHNLALDNTWNCVYYFVKNPANGIVYEATSNVHDMYASTYLQDSRIDDKGGAIIFSTDTGKTFTTMHNFGTPVIWLALDPTTPNRMYASVINATGATSPGGIYICNDIQNGASSTWTLCTAPPRTQGHPLDIKVLSDGTLITSFSGRRNSAGAFTASSGVFMSTNQGTSWTDVTDPRMEYWTIDVVVDPNDATNNTWFATVFSGWGGPANNQGGLYRTTNRGTTWTKLVNVTNQNVGDTTSVFSITFDPVNKGAAYMTAQPGGLYYTSDAEAAKPMFTQLTQYPFNQPNRVYFNPYNANEVWIGSFGNGIEMGLLKAPTSINELKVENGELKVYPNPSNGIFNIQMDNAQWAMDNEKVQVEVYNVLGEKVYSSVLSIVNSPLSIDLSKQVTGIYLYRVIDETGKCIGSGKLIKE